MPEHPVTRFGTRRRGVRAVVLVLLCAAVAAAGCGAQDDGRATGVSLRVTEGFGANQVSVPSNPTLAGGSTLLSQLSDVIEVGSPGGHVRSIGGRADGEVDGRPVAWKAYINGVASGVRPDRRALEDGDDVWWDLHRTDLRADVRAVVGSFPEPFLHGTGGFRMPVRLDCAPTAAAACDEVQKRMARAGITKASRAVIGQKQGPEILRIIVGRWRDVRRDGTANRIERGPEVSGVFARFDPAGTTLSLLDAGGRSVSDLGSGAGLVAALRYSIQEPTWVVTGTDDAGVAAAAAALDAGRLRRSFALATVQGRDVPLPATAPGQG